MQEVTGSIPVFSTRGKQVIMLVCLFCFPPPNSLSKLHDYFLFVNFLGVPRRFSFLEAQSMKSLAERRLYNGFRWRRVGPFTASPRMAPLCCACCGLYVAVPHVECTAHFS